MSAIILTLALVVLLASLGWLLFGSRLRLVADPKENDRANLAAYAAMLLPLVFVLVFYLVEHL
jgi:hypothetical protein